MRLLPDLTDTFVELSSWFPPEGSQLVHTRESVYQRRCHFIVGDTTFTINRIRFSNYPLPCG